jgi:hypothetical protein
MDIKEIVNLMDIYQKGQLTNEQLKLVQNRQFDNINLSNVVGGKIYDIDDYSPELQDIVYSGDLLSHLDKRIKSAKKILKAQRDVGIPIKHTVKLMDGVVTSVDNILSGRLEQNLSKTKKEIISQLKEELAKKSIKQERFKQKDTSRIINKLDDIDGVVIKEDEYEDSKRETNTKDTRQTEEQDKGNTSPRDEQGIGELTGGNESKFIP